jgi:hypothetical protein
MSTQHSSLELASATTNTSVGVDKSIKPFKLSASKDVPAFYTQLQATATGQQISLAQWFSTALTQGVIISEHNATFDADRNVVIQHDKSEIQLPVITASLESFSLPQVADYMIKVLNKSGVLARA